MVLGKAQLSVLRRLKDEGTVEDGLHMSVHGLVVNGFVEHIDDLGFRLTQKGQLGLLAYDEMNEYQRDILMRVHKSAAMMQVYNRDALKTAAEKEAFDDLLLAELIVVDGNDNISLTDEGRILWEVVVVAWHTKDETRSGFDAANEKQRQKKANAKESIISKVRPLPEKKAEEKRLKTEPKTWVETQQEKDSHVGQWVTIERRPEEPLDIMEVDKVMVAGVVVRTQEVTVSPPITEATDCPDCGECIHAEVLELIAAKYPKVAELRETLLHQKQILKELGL